MEVLEVQLTVHGYPILDQQTRLSLRSMEAFEMLSLRRVTQVWSGNVPALICFSGQIQKSAIFITEDWMASIHSPNLMDCVRAMCATVNALGQEFGARVEIRLVEDTDKPDSALYRQLNREQAVRRVKAAGLWILTLIAGGLVGALLQWVIGGGL